MTQKINRVSVLITNGSKFVLIFRHKNNVDYYAIPGGVIETFEIPIEAAIREIKEEFGFKLNDLKQLADIDTESRHDFIFSATTTDTNFVVTGTEAKDLHDPTNLFKPLWLDKSSLDPKLPIYPIPAQKLFYNMLTKL